MEIYLIRHGQTDWNVQGKIMGDKDSPLNDHGNKQVKKTALYLENKNIKKIFTSPVLRCRQTAEMISKMMPCGVKIDQRLTEINFGAWVGQIYDEMKKNPGFKQYYLYPDEQIITEGERFRDASRRVFEFFDEIARESENILIVSHADPIKLLIFHVLDCPITSAGKIKIDNASVSCIEIKDRPIIKFLNFVP